MGKKTYECENCEEIFESKALFRTHLKECIELSENDDEDGGAESDSSSNIFYDAQDDAAVINDTEISVASTQDIEMPLQETSSNVNGGGDGVAADAAAVEKEEAEDEDMLADFAIADVVDKKELVKIQCKRCRKDMVNEEHLKTHECFPKISQLTGTLEERKKKLFHYYKDAFDKKRSQIFERIFPIFTYQAMNELGKATANLPDVTRSFHESIKQTSHEIDLDFDKKRQMFSRAYEEEILAIPKAIFCQKCDEYAKFYCCQDGCYCSEQCQIADLHYVDCGKELKDPFKDAAIPQAKRIPVLNFDD